MTRKQLSAAVTAGLGMWVIPILIGLRTHSILRAAVGFAAEGAVVALVAVLGFGRKRTGERR
jgi:hypothetical protein